jgi:protease-4
MSTLDTIGQLSVMVLGLVISASLAVLLFGVVPEATPLGPLTVLLILAVVVLCLVVFARLAQSLFPEYNVAEVDVEGAITQSGGSPSPLPGGGSAAADEIVEQIERADEDPNAQALILNMNTPGGEVVASEDIRYAAEQFDGPTVAYATNLCASGGMWIASGCDEFHAREGSRIGSIGVNGVTFGAEGLLDKAGLEYRRFVAGDFKDTPSAFRDMRDDEIEYWQGLLDDWYEQFIETVAEGRGMDPQDARDTEARVYLGPQAQDLGLVDTLGPRPEMEANLRAELGVSEITVETFEPDRGVTEKVSLVSTRMARGFGRGVASVFLDDGHPSGQV